MSRDKEIHFINFNGSIPVTEQPNIPKNIPLGTYYSETENMIRCGYPQILTFQMSFLHTSLLEQGYRIFVHDNNGSYEIKLGAENERTEREIRIENSLFHLWQSGEFKKTALTERQLRTAQDEMI